MQTSLKSTLDLAAQQTTGLDLIRLRNRLVRDVARFGYQQVAQADFLATNGKVFSADAGTHADSDGQSMIEIRLREEEITSFARMTDIPALYIRLREDHIVIRQKALSTMQNIAFTNGGLTVNWDQANVLGSLIEHWQEYVEKWRAGNQDFEEQLARLTEALYSGKLYEYRP